MCCACRRRRMDQSGPWTYRPRTCRTRLETSLSRNTSRLARTVAVHLRGVLGKIGYGLAVHALSDMMLVMNYNPCGWPSITISLRGVAVVGAQRLREEHSGETLGVQSLGRLWTPRSWCKRRSADSDCSSSLQASIAAGSPYRCLQFLLMA